MTGTTSPSSGLSESRLAAIIESSDDAIVSKDLDGTVTTWNRGAEQIFGYSAEEMIGQSIRRIIPPDRQHEEDEVLAQIRSGNRVDHFETVRRRKNGTTVDISVTVSPIRNLAGEIVGASKIARDISSRKRAEEALKAAVDLKEQFLSLVSHELRSPVTVVISNASLLQRRRHSLSTEDYEQSLQDIVTEGRRLETVIESLLLLTRLESDRQVDLEPVSVRRLLADCVNSFLERHATRPVEVVEGSPPDLVSGQPELLAMVIENLLNNADKYSNPGSPIVVRLSTNESGEAEITVRDSGIGIDESELSHLFTPFYRSEAAASHAKGMGIGLTVCKRIVEAHGGRIWASPRSAGGTDFTFCLPGGAPDGVEGAR